MTDPVEQECSGRRFRWSRRIRARGRCATCRWIDSHEKTGIAEHVGECFNPKRHYKVHPDQRYPVMEWYDTCELWEKDPRDE